MTWCPWPRRRRGPPPWWPEGEAWPPRDPARQWRGGRSRFLLRAAIFFTAFMAFAGIGVATVVSWLAAGLRGSTPTAASWTAIVALLVPIAAFAFFAIARRVGPPLGDLVTAAHRVADGDFDVRISTRGPRSLRAVAAAFNDMAERLARQERQRRELMADVAHELRTPLSVVQGRLEGLIDGVYPTDASQLEPLVDETRVLARLVEDLRTLANAESGVLTLDREATDVGMLIRDAASAVRDEASRRAVTVVVGDEREPIVADIDPLRIRQVIVNLLANAIRHGGDGGTVTIDSRVHDGQLVVRVADTGVGMPAEELSRIFDRFYKKTGSSGSGLGLTIARSLVRAHGGEIRAESAAGTGTTITFTVPA
jgi:two-component system, OmpR family, sensor histidine kinase BaeS